MGTWYEAGLGRVTNPRLESHWRGIFVCMEEDIANPG